MCLTLIIPGEVHAKLLPRLKAPTVTETKNNSFAERGRAKNTLKSHDETCQCCDKLSHDSSLFSLSIFVIEGCLVHFLRPINLIVQINENKNKVADSLSYLAIVD